MKKYEISFIVSPVLEGEELEKLVTNFKDILTNNGASITEAKYSGLKELAYEIQDFKKGHYYILNVESNPEANAEFDRLAKINEHMIRHIVLSV